MTATLATANGPVNVIQATVLEPIEGAWTVDVQVDSDADLSGPVVLDVDGTTFQGWIRRGAQEHGRVIAQIVGGYGNVGAVIQARAYDSATIADVLVDILNDAGEILSADVDASLLLASVPRWGRPKGPAGLSIKQVADESTGDHWRVLRDGTVWIGTETWAAVPASFDYTEISRIPDQGQIVIAPEDGAALIAPGSSFLGRNVASVRTVVTAGSLRQTISWQDEDGAAVADRATGPIRRFIESVVGRRIDHSQMYPSVVNKQNSDGTLDVTPDDERVRGDGYKRIKITHGLPGITVAVPSGVRVNLYFENGNPSAPRCALWPDGSSVTSISIGAGDQSVMRGDDFLLALNTAMTAIATYAMAGVNPGKGALNTAISTVFLNPALQATFTSSVLKGE